jgi:hypothetical protein
MNLFIANCTRQKQTICYRLDFDQIDGPQRAFRPAVQRPIEPGQQVKIEADTIDQLQAVCEQLQIYGLKGVTDIPRATDFVPIVFSTGVPVKKNAIVEVMQHNERIRIIQGKDRRQRAAVASNETVVNAVASELARQELPPEAIPETVETVVDFEQLEQSEAGESRIEEGVRVSAAAPPPKGKAPAERRKPGPKPGSHRRPKT